MLDPKDVESDWSLMDSASYSLGENSPSSSLPPGSMTALPCKCPRFSASGSSSISKLVNYLAPKRGYNRSHSNNMGFTAWLVGMQVRYTTIVGRGLTPRLLRHEWLSYKTAHLDFQQGLTCRQGSIEEQAQPGNHSGWISCSL